MNKYLLDLDIIEKFDTIKCIKSMIYGHKLQVNCIILVILIFLSITPVFGVSNPTNSPSYQLIKENKLPVIRDSNYIVEEFVSGLDWPTTMTFVDNDIIVLEKNSGNVRLIKNGKLLDESIKQFNVNFIAERGLLGVISSDSTVYFYLTEKNSTSNSILGNRIYKADWNGEKLENFSLIKNLPFGERGVHNAGVFAKGLDNKIYAVIGDSDQQGILQNYHQGNSNDTSVIFDANSNDPYYAIGIRNSFGIAVDPVTGELWDTENNNKSFDEINLVERKFNSGWDPITGPGDPEQIKLLPQYKDYEYSDPEFSWELTVAPTAIAFTPESSVFDYHNSVFVGDFLNGFIYEFRLNENRTGFIFNNLQLKDLVANGGDSLNEIIFGTGFGGITDIEFGPDGLMYIVSIIDGKIYRISPTNLNENNSRMIDCSSQPYPRINFSGCDLSHRNFSGVDLAFADLSSTKIINTDFSGSRLTSANISNSIIDNSNFIDANLINVDLTNSEIIKSNFQKSQLRYVSFANSTISESIFNEAIIRGSNFEGVTIKNSDFVGSTLYHSNLRNSIISNSDFTDADLRYSKFNNTNLIESILKRSDLSHAEMSSMNIEKTSLQETIMTYVDFSNSKISESNFEGSYPYSSDFTNTEIMKDTITDSCIDQDLISRIFNKILRELRSYNSEITKPIEFIFVQLCKP